MVSSSAVETIWRVTLAKPLAPVVPGFGGMVLLDGTSISTFTFTAGLLSGLVTLTWQQRKSEHFFLEHMS